MKVTVIENKIPDNTSFITTVEFNRLRKITFDTWMKKAPKKYATKSEMKNLLDLGENNREKNQKNLNV